MNWLKICQFDIFLNYLLKIDYDNTITTHKGAKDGWYDKSKLHSNV
jgi:hypothetical protein